MSVKPIKLIEISGKSWMAGLSVQSYIAVGGIFGEATNFDPFERMGVWIPSIQGTGRGSGTINTDTRQNLRYIVDWSNSADSGHSYFYAFCNKNTVYSVKSILSGTVTDVSAQVNFADGSDGPDTSNGIRGAIRYRGKIIYISDTTVFTGSIPLTLANQSRILIGLTSVVVGGALTAYPIEHIPHVGPDRNLYITNGNSIARVTTIDTTTGNATQYLSFEAGIRIRDITDDGQYLVIAGDDNRTSDTSGSNNTFSGQHRCFVAFWNMKSQDLTRIWEFRDGRIYSIEKTEDEIIIYAVDNIYTCNINNPIRPLIPLRGKTTIPTDSGTNPANTIRKGTGIVLWAYSSVIAGYGRPHPYSDKVLFKLNRIPPAASASSIPALFYNGAAVWASTNSTGDGSRLYDFDLGSTRNSSTVSIAAIDFKRPYKFAYAKAVFRKPLASGEMLQLKINTANGNREILARSTVSNASQGAVSGHIFWPAPNATASNQTHTFENTTQIQMNNVGAEVTRFELWGYPMPEDQTTGF